MVLTYTMPRFLSVRLMGGLGNRLFQLAGLHTIAGQTGRIAILTDISLPSPHSNGTYFDTLFKRWKAAYDRVPAPDVHEPDHLYRDWKPLLATLETACMVGYFQDYRYVTPEFIKTLVFPTECLSRHPDISTMIFLHIRGGDYIGHAIHDVPLDSYYERALAMFPGATFAVFTNDVEYAKTKPWLATVPHVFIDEPDVESLVLMRACAGGICANSTFSWWGAYLNPHRKLILPDTWSVNSAFRSEGLYFPEATVVSVTPPTDAYCIHLAHRTDRKAHMEALARKYPCLRIHTVDALTHSDGGIGGNLSHKKAIREAKARGDPFVLVLEDDCEMLVSNAELADRLATIKEFIRDHPEVEIVNGCGNLTTFSLSSRTQYKDMWFLTSMPVYTAHWIVYCAASYDKLLASTTDVPADVVTNECAMVFTYPYLATQIPSYSDIQKADVSYENIERSRTFVRSALAPPPVQQHSHIGWPFQVNR